MTGKEASQPASQPVSQSASQPVSQSASQPVSQSASQPVRLQFLHYRASCQVFVIKPSQLVMNCVTVCDALWVRWHLVQCGVEFCPASLQTCACSCQALNVFTNQWMRGTIVDVAPSQVKVCRQVSYRWNPGRGAAACAEHKLRCERLLCARLLSSLRGTIVST